MAHHPLPIAVLVSGRGSNLQALIDAQRSGALAIEIRGVFSDKPNAPALDLARAAQIPALAVAPSDFPDRSAHDHALFAQIDRVQPALIVLAGYMRRLSADVVSPRSQRMINIHPSLLPKYPGLHTHRRALAAGDAMHGASVHFVTPELDGGPVIAQVELPIFPGQSEEQVAARLLPLEHRLLLATLALFVDHRCRFDGTAVSVDGSPLQQPLRLDRAAARIDGALS